MADFELIDYVIPLPDDFLIRKNALIIAAVGIYEPIEFWGVFAGGGIEFEQHHNFAVFRAGTAYEFQLGHNWNISPSLIFDFKKNIPPGPDAKCRQAFLILVLYSCFIHMFI